MLRIVLAILIFCPAGLALAKGPAAVSPSASVTCQLPIPPRLQWPDRAGYCGECAIQQAALYYGNYVSQFVCRHVIDPEQQQDVLVQVNADRVLAALRLKYEDFPTEETATPQYKPYLEWTKRHLNLGHPVILTVYDRNETARDYDHIVLATGFKAKSVQGYRSSDILIFNDMFDAKAQRREFRTLHDTREMQTNGAAHDFCIPHEYNFGCAITGLADNRQDLLPVRVQVDRNDEPDVVDDERPVTLKLNVTVRDLKAGASYVVYRFDDYKQLPAGDDHKAKAISQKRFVAEREVYEFADACQSDSAAFYRCLPASAEKPSKDK
jgi:hypothetical protein